jgi:ppGpp synthetase/RelA/SpoT-type nucleotidyltranferase
MSDLEDEYRRRFPAILVPLAEALEGHLKGTLQGEARIDRISARAKATDRFIAKANATEGGESKYTEPLREIQDQVGARIVTFYLSDVERIAAIIERYYRRVESRVVVPDSESEFGYFGRHYILLVPSDLMPSGDDKSLAPEFFELQIKTLFQHAWAEANHDLGYKPQSAVLSRDARRRIAYTSAQAWGADRMFNELFREFGENASVPSDGH